MKTFLPRIAALLLVALGGSCDNSFSPKAPFHPELVVFSILDKGAPMQVVRLGTTYDSTIGGGSSSHDVTQADVAVIGGGRTVTFQDTLLTDASGVSYRAWISRSLVINEEQTYTLRVRVTGFPEASSTIRIPGKLFVRGDLIGKADSVQLLKVYPSQSSSKVLPEGMLYRVWVTLRHRIGGPLERREVPINFDTTAMSETFPSPSKNRELLIDVKNVERTRKLLLGEDTTIAEINLLLKSYSMDKQFYTYYKIVRGFDDPVSIRLDSPDISFIENGRGVFGASIPDSMSYNYKLFFHIK